MPKIVFIIFSLFLSLASVFAQDDYENPMETKSFLIIISTKNYKRALTKAQLACNDLGLHLDLNNTYRDKENGGLTSSKVCGCGEQHGYVARGRSDDGNYISIEYSDAFEGFTPGYYIVVVSSGYREDVGKLLPEVKEAYKDAYIKDSEVYVGCMH